MHGFLDPALLTLVAILGAMVMTLGGTFGWALYRARAERLPAATRYEDITERLAVRTAEHARLEDRIHEMNQKIHERDRLVAELDVLERRIETARLEYENLAAAREEIEQVKAEAAAAAHEKVEAEQALRPLQDEAARLQAELAPERIAELVRKKEEAEQGLEQISAELAQLTAQRDAALRVMVEAHEVETRIEVLRQQAQALGDDVGRLGDRRAELAEEAAKARQSLETALHACKEAEAAREQAERKHDRLESELATLEVARDQLAGEIAATTGATGKPTEEQREAMLADLVKAPACLASPAVTRRTPRGEMDGLHGVAQYLDRCGLSFSRRTLHAFHTALKINDAAQLTVLAGVSGTGKSLLPRRYAEAMGMHFLQIAVEPRWDSPQDLLGFYNYVEQKYRATELARLMIHFDPWNSLAVPQDGPERGDHMALLLLDEMNLARVEYYFSEFLSRLEARPPWRRDLAREACKDALIPVDIRGLDSSPHLFPAHNMLFVGTMNDDESTQSLSDKVLDRGNVLQFPAPDEFPQPAQAPAPRRRRRSASANGAAGCAPHPALHMRPTAPRGTPSVPSPPSCKGSADRSGTG